MGIESDQLVFDYLSRVGDLAQQRQLPANTRMRLVSALRDEIDRRRTQTGADSPVAVRRILGRLGTPDEVVESVSGPSPSGLVRPAVPQQRGVEVVDFSSSEAAPEEWWRLDDAELEVPGFVGGVEVPELLKPPPKAVAEAEASAEETAAEETAVTKRRFGRVGRVANPFLLVAALLLLGGAVFGNLLALAAGWALAYVSRRLTRTEAKWAVLGLPALVAAASAIWLWGRAAARWGPPIPPGPEALTSALSTTWPWSLKTAAVASAAFLLWRARRG
ncbi:hypothetical protein [Streptomyces purpureus]|uniref:Membrane protein n=1 Tax=Streptomyces purpureus TaxID=1951 RepID=A0A918LR50_9ACTN|nr:hypothetical protein [Streptomyces purpureus]GGT37007.1 membrane protein [Streptomyces purpureus]